ncbi:MAG: alpha/beta fold hydrolase [Thermomonas sp.]|uniref:alpha/beta hydrolase n=1 Tax=Thermomonas sp. TaxID=1971895 RepID=UPI001EBC45EF|nr:alpha/beta fold hydrolase [Thermomonas sp.]MBV2207992.1 alpha/beta fold hydrolase [Thermomonas sp.]
MHPSLIAAALSAALALSTGLHAQTVAPSTLATQVLDLLDSGQYSKAETLFGRDMAQAVPADKLKAVWESLPAQVGKSTGRGDAHIGTLADNTLVQIPLHYEKAELVAKIAINPAGQVIGFVIQPAQTAAALPAPAITADAKFSERELSVGSGERALPATLAMPKGNGPFPAVVLVHGSGPQDRDESIGANKPFLDLARGLAEQGIAVLRYEKRTKARPQDFASGNFTIDDETTNDAVLAVDTLRKVDGIDPKHIFVLGHSQGGMMAPRIAAVSGHVAGLVLLAAPSRPLLDIVIEQNRRLAALNDGKIDDAERTAINVLVNEVRKTRDSKTDPSTHTVMGLPAGYWRSVDAVDPIAEAERVKLPMLLLQGARDIQVVDADWQNWRDAFDGNATVRFKLYDTLNHLGIAGKGEGSLAEYQQPGHVDAQLIKDIATWVKAH